MHFDVRGCGEKECRLSRRERNDAELDFPVGPSGHVALRGGQIRLVARQRLRGKQGNKQHS